MNESSTATTTSDLSAAFGAANNGAGVNLDLTYQGVGTNTLPGQPGFVNSPGDLSTYVDGSSTSGVLRQFSIRRIRQSYGLTNRLLL